MYRMDDIKQYGQRPNSNYFEQSFERAVGGGQLRDPGMNVRAIEGRGSWESKAMLPVPPGMGSGGGGGASRPWQAANTEAFVCHSNVAVGTPIDFPASIPSVPRGLDAGASALFTPSVGVPLCSAASDGVPVYLSAPSDAYYATSFSPSGSGSLERRLRSQERNRIAAMKSRQRKKREWERLIESEAAVSRENARLKEEVARLHEEVERLREEAKEPSQHISV